MKLFKNKFTNEIIEFIGMGKNNECFFRYPSSIGDFKNCCFSIDKNTIKRYYIPYNKNDKHNL